MDISGILDEEPDSQALAPDATHTCTALGNACNSAIKMMQQQPKLTTHPQYEAMLSDGYKPGVDLSNQGSLRQTAEPIAFDIFMSIICACVIKVVT